MVRAVWEKHHPTKQVQTHLENKLFLLPSAYMSLGLHQGTYNTGYTEKLFSHLLCKSLTWMVQFFSLQSHYNLTDIRQRLIRKQIHMPQVWFVYPSPAVHGSSHLWSVHRENPTLPRHPLYHQRLSCMQWICCTSRRYSGLVCLNSVPRSRQILTWKGEESFRKQVEHNLKSWYLFKLGMCRKQDRVHLGN